MGGKAGWVGENLTEKEGGDTADIDLPPQQVELVNAVTALGKPTVAVVAMGRPQGLAPVIEKLPAVAFPLSLRRVYTATTPSVSSARPMVKTYGLTHLAIGVRDPARAYAFYRAVLGMEAVYAESDFIQAQTPGTRDVLVFERAPGRAGRKGGIAHFGFRLTRPEDISTALHAVESAGGRILSHGEFCPGEPYLFCEDPDGYELEIWYELPTPIDPKPRSERGRAASRGARRAPRRSKKTT